ncbi:MAG: methyltransferase domain-containing protein [Gammaproteobacteria bacterium]|nr:methyltransferase domain-containing protein [Gammaproteobacteria bacterium]
MLADVNKQQSWNQRYQQKQVDEQLPAPVLTLNQKLLPAKGSVLDLACGLGGNAIFLAKLGYEVSALDYSAIALEKLALYAQQNRLSIKPRLLDLQSQSLEPAQYDVVVVSYYLQRDLFPVIFDQLKTGGLLFYQTFGVAADNASGPKNPAFRLSKGELLSLCTNHSVLFYREDQGCCIGDECFNNDAMIVVRKNRHE